MCIILSAFTTYKSIKPILINLPNGNHVYVEYSGTVVFNNKFYLINVLYVPHFSFTELGGSRVNQLSAPYWRGLGKTLHHKTLFVM